MRENGIEDLIAVKLSYKRTGAVVISDIGRVLREKIAYYLVDGIIALLYKCVIYRKKRTLHFRVLFVSDTERLSLVFFVGWHIFFPFR